MEELREENGISSCTAVSLLILRLGRSRFVSKIMSSSEPHGAQYGAIVQHMTQFTHSVGKNEQALNLALSYLFRAGWRRWGTENQLWFWEVHQQWENGRQKINHWRDRSTQKMSYQLCQGEHLEWKVTGKIRKLYELFPEQEKFEA